MFTRVSLLLALLLPLTALAAPPGGKPMAMPVYAAPVSGGVGAESLEVVGSIEANESVVIRPEVAGVVRRILFTEGDPVRRGVLLVQLDDAEQQAARAQALAVVQRDQNDLTRAKELAGRNFVSQQNVDDAAARLATDRATLALADARLAKTRIRAPFSGVAGLRQISPGAFVLPGQDIVQLLDLAVVKVRFAVPERSLGALKAGLSVSIRVDSFPDVLFAGRISRISPSVDSVSRTVTVVATVSNREQKLRPGMFARVKLAGTAGQSLWIPEQALMIEPGGNFVYRIEAGVAKRIAIKIGGRQQGRVQVREGLKAGDLVVREGQLKLHGDGPVMVIGEK